MFYVPSTINDLMTRIQDLWSRALFSWREHREVVLMTQLRHKLSRAAKDCGEEQEAGNSISIKLPLYFSAICASALLRQHGFLPSREHGCAPVTLFCWVLHTEITHMYL